MAAKLYSRMGINVGALISEVHTRPVLWDKSSSGYSNRNLRDAAWLEVCVALYPDWGRYEKSLRWVIEQDVRKRWKNVRDRFLKWHRQVPASGSSLSRLRKVPHHDELLFILPQRRLRTSGNYKSSQMESPDEEDGQQLRERKPTPSTLAAGPSAGDPEQQAGPSGVGQSQPGEDPFPSTSAVDLLEPNPVPPTRTSFTRGQRTHRARDRQLEVDSETLSLIQGVEDDDEWDFFGYGLAALCRRLPPEVRSDYVAFCQAAATDFGFGNPLRLGALISHMRAFTQAGPRDASSTP